MTDTTDKLMDEWRKWCVDNFIPYQEPDTMHLMLSEQIAFVGRFLTRLDRASEG